jgi:glycosyltransferase involved in cell wall biosynthesis
MSNAPPITFAIPFYRNLDFLARAITSVLRQHSEDWRVIVCDDAGTTAGARDLVASYADTRISAMRNFETLGLAGNWNRCLDLADTDFVTLLHADDELAPTYTSIVLKAHERHDATAVYTRVRVIDAAGRPMISFPDVFKRLIQPHGGEDAVLAGEAGLARLMRGNFIFCPTLCFRRSSIGPTPFDPRWRHVVDLALLSDLLLRGDRIVGLPQVAYSYRRHPNSETVQNTASLLRFKEQSALLDEVSERAMHLGWSRAANVAARKRIMWSHLCFRVFEDAMHGRWSAVNAKVALARSGDLNQRTSRGPR